MKKDLQKRWETVEKSSPNSSPFPVTSEGLQDFRGITPFRDGGGKGLKFENADFSFADFSKKHIESCLFEHCSFVGVNFKDLNEHKCRFNKCSFIESDFRGAALGFYSSSYENCEFVESNFRKTLFENAIFQNTHFLNNNISGVDFSASGFWNCHFEGIVSDVWFRGGFPTPKKYVPQKTGLHNVDFSKAKLSLVTISNACEIENVLLPKDGDIFVADLRGILKVFASEVLIAFDDSEKKSLGVWLNILKVHSDKQNETLIAKHDICQVCGDTIGTKLFLLLKSKFDVRANH